MPRAVRGFRGAGVFLWARYLCTGAGGPTLVKHARKVDIRIPGKGNSNSRGARPVY